MKDITITIPDNCELVKEGNTYVIKEKDSKPKSWEEFCIYNKIKLTEYHIANDSRIVRSVPETHRRDDDNDRNICVSKEEAEAFLALMQLRQLRKAWVGDWKPWYKENACILYDMYEAEIKIGPKSPYGHPLSFPTAEMAQEFFECFKDLCETAKMLL